MYCSRTVGDVIIAVESLTLFFQFDESYFLQSGISLTIQHRISVANLHYLTSPRL